MNDPALSGTRVRPALRRFAIAAFAVLLPIAAHSLWDYIEVRRLVREIEGIRAKNEPVSEREAVGGGAPAPSEERGAAEYYLAGAMLALGTDPSLAIAPIREWLAEPNPDRQALQQRVTPLHELVQNSRDALMLADQAAGLPFAGFPAGTEYPYRVAGASDLSELITARTVSLSALGSGDAAVDSVISGLQIRRALHDARWFLFSGHQVAAVLSLSEPSAEALRRLDIALEAEDRPEQPIENFVRERAGYVELMWRRYYGTDPSAPQQYSLPMRSLTETVMRPWFTHHLVEVLHMWAELIDVARTPWPDKARASAAALEKLQTELHSRPGRSFGNLPRRDLVIGLFTRAVDATELIIDRSARVAVAVERFRRDRGDLPEFLSDLVPRYLTDIPADPYSGQSLSFRRVPAAYTIYSVGPNQDDEGGDVFAELPPTVGRRWGRHLRGADVGLRVLMQPGQP